MVHSMCVIFMLHYTKVSECGVREPMQGCTYGVGGAGGIYLPPTGHNLAPLELFIFLIRKK